ncbi:MAG: ABC transporter ATP-binding protein [Alphaproteobacteria bacterium]
MAGSLLRIDDLAVDFHVQGRRIPAVDGVSLTLDKGETLALVGESGSGKSVTALSIMQLLPYPTARHPGGSIRFKGEEMIAAPQARLRAVRGAEIGMIFQEPKTALNPVHTIGRQVAESLILHQGLSRTAARARVLELLDMVRLSNARQRIGAFPHELSGGQIQRVVIAMALANQPDLLIADEPTTALDVTIQAQILELLEQLQSDLGMAMLFITHDLGIVRRFADRVAVMQAGKIVEQGAVAAVFDNPAHAYTRHLLSAEPSGRPTGPAPDAPIVVESPSLRVWYPIKGGVLRFTRGHVKAVNDVPVAVRQGQTLGVVGESGSGKTTLGMALLRLIPSQGDIRFDGTSIRDLRGRALRRLRSDMQIVFQDPFGSLSPRMSIAQIIEEGLRVHQPGLRAGARDEQIVQVMGEVGLDPATRHRYPHEFSGGQRQRVSIARALILKPRFIVLDEPTSALDRSVQAQVIDLLRDIQARHKLAYLFISHDLKVVRAIADHIVVLKDGYVMEAGPADQVFEQPRAPYTRALMRAAFDLQAADDDAGLLRD